MKMLRIFIVMPEKMLRIFPGYGVRTSLRSLELRGKVE